MVLEDADGLAASTASEGSAGGGSDDICGGGDQGKERSPGVRFGLGCGDFGC